MNIRKSISYHQLYSSLERFQGILDEVRFMPDIIVGVHYQGTSFAALLAKIMYKPLLIAEIKYRLDGERHICESIIYRFDPEIELKEKKVLILDNSMATGRTIEMVKADISKHTNEVKTCVVVHKYTKHDPRITPDYVIFEAKRPIEFLA